MSINVMNWAFSQPLAGNEKVILLCLADWADDDGMCFPSINKVAKKAYVSEATARRVLLALSDEGYISTVRRNVESGRQTSNQYLLHINPEKQGEGVNLRPSVNLGEGITDDRGEGITVDTPYEPSQGTITTTTPRARGGRVPDDFYPNEAGIRLAHDLRIPISMQTVSEFLDYWRSVPGAKGRKLDWQATFRNQLRHISKSKGNHRATTHRQPTLADNFAAIDAAIASRERELAEAQRRAG